MLGAGPVARRRRTGVGVCVCVCVVRGAAEWVCEACWWDGGAIAMELGVRLCKEEGLCSYVCSWDYRE